MRLSDRLVVQYFLLISCCYCHNLNHAEPVTIKQSESPVTTAPIGKPIETKNVQINENENVHDTVIDARFRVKQELRKATQESHSNDQSSTSSSDISTATPVPVSATNDVFKTIPISGKDLYPQVVEENLTPPPVQIPSHIPLTNTDQPKPSETQSQQQEQLKSISEHIPTLSKTTPDTNSVDLKSDQPAEQLAKDIKTVENEAHLPVTTPASVRVLRSATARLHEKAHGHSRHVRATKQFELDGSNELDNTNVPQSNNEQKQSTEPSIKPREPLVETTQPNLTTENNNNTQTQTSGQILKPVNISDLPRQVHVHDPTSVSNAQNSTNASFTEEKFNRNENLTVNEETENTTYAHLPRIVEDNETKSAINSTNETVTTENNTNETKTEENNNTNVSTPKLPLTLNTSNKNRQICWHLPKKFEPSIELLENQIFRLINILPEFIRTIVFGPIDDREILMNTMWFSSICSMCFLFSFFFLSMGAKRLKQGKYEKEARSRCQQLQQYNNQIELERATFERQNQKLSDEIDELKMVPMRDADEEVFALREECTRFHDDLKTTRSQRDSLQQDIDYKQNLVLKHEFEMQRQVETVACLNNEILQLKEELEKDRGIIARLQSNDLSLERFEKAQEVIQELKAEISQLKQEKFTHKDQFQEMQEYANQLDIEKSQLTLKMKQLKNILEQRNQTLKLFQENMTAGDSLSILKDEHIDQDEDLLSTVDNDVEKSSQHIRDLQTEIQEKARRIKEFDLLFKQEKERCREMETKLKIVLELRERDAHLHIRQLGQTDAELRKARTDTERVRILQKQLELKQQQLDDVQKLLTTEQSKFNEDCSKLQHEVHEKWMEVKRLTRDLDSSKKESEGLRKQITKYASSERNSQEKSIHKPVPHHTINNGGHEANGHSPYQQGENFRSIDHQRTDSGATSPAEILLPRPPALFGLTRPPFFPSPFMPPPPPNAFMMHPRFPMPNMPPSRMMSPLSHLITNGNDGNNSELIDSLNATPNSTNYDAQSNGAASSPVPTDEQQTKTKKPKKSLKKKIRTSVAREDV